MSNYRTCDIKRIKDELSQADDFALNGKDEQSMDLLNETRSEAFLASSDESNPNRAEFQSLSDSIVSIEQKIQNGDRDNASQQIRLILNSLDASNQAK
jgi:hypothetical protein